MEERGDAKSDVAEHYYYGATITPVAAGAERGW